jgi:hemolysin activation/secretion protein
LACDLHKEKTAHRRRKRRVKAVISIKMHNHRGIPRAVALFFSAIAAIGSAAPPACAQDSGGEADRAQIERRIDDVRDEAAPRARPEEEERATTLPPAAPAPTAVGIEPFILTGVVLEGADAIDPERLAATYDPFLAQRIGGAELAEILAAIETLYREEGYLLARAEAPAQAIEAGVVTVQVAEGHVETLALEGADGVEETVRGLFSPVLAERPIRLATLERAIMLTQDLPGVTVQDSRMERIDEAGGAHRLTIVVETDAVDGVAYLDNRGDREIGPAQAWLSGGINNALGMGERLSAGIFTVPNDPQELVYGELRADTPIGNAGTRAEFAASGSTSDSGGNLDETGTENRSRTLAASLTHPIIRSREEILTVGGGIEMQRLEEFQREDQSYEDRTRIVTARVAYTRYGLFDGTDAGTTLSASQGLDVLNASTEGDEALSRAEGSGVFTRGRAEIWVTQGFGDNLSLLLQGSGQVADRPLLTGQEFSVGGSRFGRAYNGGEIAGEHGASGLAELRWTDGTAFLGLAGYQLYGFYDAGAVWNEAANGDIDRESLSSAGAGLRFWTEGYRLYFDVQAAQPLTRTPDATDDDGTRFFISGTGQF